MAAQTDPHLALFNQALRLHLAGDKTAAETAYRQILALKPDDANARHYLGFLLQQNEQWAEALAELQRAVALDERHAEWFFNLGIVLSRLAKHEAAIDAFCRAIAIDPAPYFYWTNLGSVFEANQETERAEQCYLKATQINPNCADAFYLLSAMLLKQTRYDEARRFNHRGIIAAPAESKSRVLLGQAYYELGQPEAAIAVFAEWLAADLGNAEAAHFLSVYKKEATLTQCAPAYVEQIFDGFASTFDDILGRLGYSGPQWLADYLAAIQPAPVFNQVLDLGCGTGLAGVVLRPYATQLIGVDLSQRMLDEAHKRGIYQQLVKADMVDFLAPIKSHYDLITCMDTLIYLGQLDMLFARVYQALAPGGRFVFTTEKRSEGAADYQLNISGRFSHSPDYVRRALADSGLALMHAEDATVRREAGCPIIGEFIWVTRPD